MDQELHYYDISFQRTARGPLGVARRPDMESVIQWIKENEGRLNTLAEDACILCDEEGRLKGKPYNTTVCGVPFVGTILIVGTSGEEFADLTEEQERALRDMGAVT